MIKELYQEDKGIFCFFLQPDERLMGLLPPDLREKVDDPADTAECEFHAFLDCRSMQIDVSAMLRGCPISDLALELPRELADDLRKDVYLCCEQSFGKDVMAAADEHLASCGMRMEIRDWMDRLKHMDFGKMTYGVRDLYSDDLYPIFGDGIVVGVSERMPSFLEGLSATLKENGLGKTELLAGYKAFDFAPIEFGEEHKDLVGHDTVFKIDDEAGKALMDGDYDIARYYADLDIMPSSNSVILQIQAKDSDDSARAWIGFDELKELVRPENMPSQENGPKA